jgi:hypothetical protein
MTATWLPLPASRFPFGPGSYTNAASYANAAAAHHGLMRLPEWQQDAAAKDLCQMYSITGVMFACSTDAEGRPHPDAGFTLTPAYLDGDGNWYEYD